MKKKSNTSTITKKDGSFALFVSDSSAQLIISYIGYVTTEVAINKQTNLSVMLMPATSALNAVVVIGYGTTKKKDLTGAVASVPEKDFNKGMFASPDQLIQGKVSGVQITYNNGQPGGSSNIKIRGNSTLTGTGQPLFVIDGVPLDGRSPQASAFNWRPFRAPNNPLNFINPDDIVSIDVLKDASATAIYGSRAAYGVVIINTKKGHPGKTKLDVSGSAGVVSILKKIKVLNASQYRDALKYYNVEGSWDNGGDVDAQDAICQNGLQQNYTIGIEGGNESGKYRLSGNYLDQNGLIKNSEFKKVGADFSTSFKFLDSKRLGLDLNLISSQYIQTGSFPIDGQAYMITSALVWNPTTPLKKADGSLNIFGGDVTNPLAIAEFEKTESRVTTVLGNISPYYKFTNWLEYRLLFSINYSSGISRYSHNEMIQRQDRPRGYASIGNNEFTTKQITHTLSFTEKIFHDLNLDALAGFEYMRYKAKGFSTGGDGPDSSYGNFGLDYTNYIQYGTPGGSSFADPTVELQSFFGRAIFNYQDKYLLTATFRADGSTKFGKNNKYGYFPSFAVAWNISKENFFKTDFINSLKIRGGWGKTGNQEFPSGSSQARYSFTGTGAITQVNSPNPNLKWQSDNQYNVGVDLSIFNNRISGTLDYFNKATTNLLFPSPPIQPAPPAASVRWINLPGKIINKGFEVLLNASIVSNKKISFDLSVNATFQKNTVSNFPSPIATGYLQGSGVSDATVQVIQNGLPMQTFYTRKFLGMDKATGFAIYADNGETFYNVGNPNPKTLAGVNSTLRYKKLSLTVNMYGAFGQDIFYNTLMNLINVGNIGLGKNIALSVYQDPVKESPANPITPSSRFIFKGNYIKMSNLTISYNLGDVTKIFKEANIYLTGQNLFIITKYPGFDPEANFDGSNNGVPSLSIDWAQYPSSRTIIFGLSFSL